MLDIIIHDKTYFINVHFLVCYARIIKEGIFIKSHTREFYKELLQHSYFVSHWCHSVTLIIVDNWVRNICGIILARESWSSRRKKTTPSTPYSTRNPTWISPILNLDLCSERLVNNFLQHGITFNLG